MSADKELFTLEGFQKMKLATQNRINKAINSSTNILESVKSSFHKAPKSYKLLELVPGAIEAPKRERVTTEDLTIVISEKYSSRVNSKQNNKKKDLKIKRGINGMIKDWNIIEGNANTEINNGDSGFKDFVTEAKAAEFVIKFLDRMQSKKYAMNYDNVSMHVKGETQLDRQLSAYPLFVSTISHASMGLSNTRRDGSLYDIVGGVDPGLGTLIGNFKNNKQIFDRSPLVQLSQELERDTLLEKAPSWSSKLLPSIGTKLDYQTFDEEKALGVYSKDKINKESIMFRQFRQNPSAGRMGKRFTSLEGSNTLILQKDDVSNFDDTPNNSKNKKSQGNLNSSLQILTDLNKIPTRFPWILEELPIAQSFKNQFLLFNENSSLNKSESKEENVKKTFYQKAKGLSNSTLRQENIVKAIVSNRGIAMVRNITNVPADSNLEAYFDELDDNSDNDERYLWEDDRERKNQQTKEIGVQKYMEETSFDTDFQNNEPDLESLMKDLEIHYNQIKSERNENNSPKQGNNCQSPQNFQFSSSLENDSKDFKDLHHPENIQKSSGSVNNIKDNELNIMLLQGMNPYSGPEIKIEYDLSELYNSERNLYRGEGIEKTWKSYYDSLKNYQDAVNQKKEYMEMIHYNMSPSRKILNGSQSRKSKIPKSFLPIHESLQQEDDPQEEYYSFVQGQRMIKESINQFPIQSHTSAYKTVGEDNIHLVGPKSRGYIRGLAAVRGGRRIKQRLIGDRSNYENQLRSRKEDLGFLKYTEKDREEFLEHVRYNNKKIQEMYEMEDKFNTKVRIASRGRFKKIR
ncbi:hypothetical protein [Cryptosporidium parvum Iowa II]|uniref:Uncharacterized protein n=2 Tax=Cryptosporidium parvum TaxID=5807 RepID=Q5CT84_CRYPI|nr:hypothetical protein [Cryptosporidium parvum Iowa II]EAK88633.1 hypothetical protein cgd2_4030 [Cryptosporidium parvum Iowa II]QOY42825.1 Uncharacterized protein CPATCC_0026760 [Cryptosporidium parvum]WKS76703.1 hypothetical protein CPCDC_2g4030 [Cryptosporidium sp. 43IA8]WRK31196.1 Uncharacterized protein cpbgf_2004030 [Cryptosporidium parvum]|eukprot:QOY42825.1 hypothetical protein CPATCC_000504 [Cryptosporidium parvum]